MHDRSEKKFILTPENEKRLTKDAEFSGERKFTDVYYDSTDYALTTNDIWLRARNGHWELKVSIHTNADRSGDQYEEIEDEARIRERINMSAGENLENDLALSGYAPFCTITTVRREYKNGLFTIDLDEGRWDGGAYTLAEIELMVNEASEATGALEKIKTFATERGLALTRVHGKVAMYLKQFRPEHFHALVEAGVVGDY